MKRFALLLALLIILTGCVGDRREQVCSRVQANQAALEDAIEAGEPEKLEGRFGIDEVTQKEDSIEFSCGASGFGSETEYWGFFYSPDDDLGDAWLAPEDLSELVPSGDGFFWEEPEGDNTLYVEHICGHFYYYEVTF